MTEIRLNKLCEGCAARNLDEKLKDKRTYSVIERTCNVFGMNTFLLWMLISLVCVTRTYAVTPPFITQHPEDDTTLEGNTEVIRCSAISDVPLEYLWSKNGVRFGSFSASASSYRLSNIQKSDAGEYRCLVEHPVGIIMSEGANIFVAYLGHFPQLATSLTATAGNAYIFDCPSIDSFPVPTLSWLKDGSILNSGGRTLVTLDGRLVIIDVQSSDEGSYNCKAINSVSFTEQTSQSITLTVDGINSLETIDPVITVPPRNVIVHAGESLAELECIVNTRPLDNLLITWKKDGIIYKTGGPELFKIQIRNPRMINEGLYECEALLPETSHPPVTASANLTYFTMPSFTVVPEDTTTSPVDSTVVIPCQAVGTPQPTLEWYRNAEEVSPTRHDRYQILTTGSLQIRDLEKGDAGMFQCRIYNEVGEVISDTWLQVNEIAPQFTISPSDTVILTGQETVLACIASGAPLPTIEWYKDDAFVANAWSTEIDRYIFENGNLTINQAVTTDSGIYTCKATNTKGSINSTATLQVYLQTTIRTRPRDTEQVLGETADLDCIVHHDERILPSIVWHRNDQPLDTSSNRIRIMSTGSLRIRTVTPEDSGDYKCIVTSLAGNDTAEAALLIIQLPFAPERVQAAISPFNTRTIILSWVPPFNGDTPLLRYIIKQKEDQSSFREIESNVSPSLTTFPVTGLKPSRSYQFRIRAENKIGPGEASTHSDIVTLPEEPPDDPAQRVVASASSSNTIIVEWQEPSEDSWNGILVGYIVHYRLDGYDNNNWTEQNITNVRQTSFTIADLLTWNRYEIQVAAYNSAGVGTYSDSVREQTYEGVPSKPPQHVSIRAVNSTTILLTWDPPPAWSINGINQGYKLHAWEQGMEESKIEVIVPHISGQSNFSEYMENLKKYTSYTVAVLCYTNPGNGPGSPARVVRTFEDVPGPVNNLMVSNVQAMSLTLEWGPPTDENGIIRRYSVSYFSVNDTIPILADLLPDRTHLHVTQLTAETTYSFSVWAATNVGEGEVQTTSIKSGIPPVRPEPPTTLAASNVRARIVYLQFTPGHDGHASISKWSVEALIDSANWTRVFSLGAPDSTGFDVTGLRPNTDYTFRMIATNVAGNSTPSESSNTVQTLLDVPEIAPKEVNVRAYSEQSLRVRWVPLVISDWNGNAQGYIITWSPVSRYNPTSYTIEDPYSSEYIITNLQQYTDYTVSMKAVNIIGEGPPSGSQSERTHETVPSAGPENTSAVVDSYNSVTVTWEDIAESDRNGQILGYKVLYQEVDEPSRPMVADVPGIESHEITIGGLRGYTSYSIQVLGTTRIGDGVPSNRITITTDEYYPGPPKNLYFPTVTESIVLLEWEEPEEPNGVIINYQVGYRLSINSESTESVTTALEFIANDLQDNVQYTFTVRAQTSVGWGEPAAVDVITSNQRDAPDAPSNLKISQVGSRQVDISWIPGRSINAPLRHYNIQSRTQLNWVDQAMFVPGNVLVYTLTGLQPDVSYQFRMQAVNDVGTSPYSTPSTFTSTGEDIPEGSPTIINVIPYTVTSVNVTWQAPPESTHNGDLLGYRLVFRQLTDSSSQLRIINEADILDYNLANLVKYQNYEIKVAAFNFKGTGPFSRPFTVYVGEAVPSAPPTSVNIHSSTPNSIIVSWSAPPEDSLNGGLQGYKIVYWEIDAKRDATRWTRTYSTASTTVVLDGLICATVYGFVVRGFNSAGDGPASEVQTIETDEDVPGEVAFLEFSQIRMTSMVVFWGPPARSCGTIISYKLSYRSAEAIDGELSSISRLLHPSQRFVVSGLGEKVRYVFQISARTAAHPEYGTYVEKNITTGPQIGAPDKPGNVRLDSGDDLLILSWETPTSFGKSPLLRYIIEYKEEGQNDWIFFFDDIGPSERKFEFFIQELKTSTVYAFRVSAENSQSVSEPGYLPEPFSTKGSAMQTPANFYEESWFLIIIALVGVIIIILVGATLCMLGRSKLYSEKKGKRVNHVPRPQPDDTDFPPPLEMNSRRGIRNGNYAGSNSYRRPPPKPSPGSVQYSEEEESKHYENLAKRDAGRDAGETSSLTDRYTESIGSESESDLKAEAMDTFVNHYASLPSTQNWRQQQGPQAYSYTDSEPDQSAAANVTMYNNGLAHMQAGSREPIHGFSSFV